MLTQSVTSLYSITAIAGNLALVASVMFLAYQVWLQRQDLRFSTYDRLMSDFTQLDLVLVNDPRLAFYVYPDPQGELTKRSWDAEFTEEERSFYYIDALLGLFERAWMARKKSKAYYEHWLLWENWIRYVTRGPVFRKVFERNKEFYDPRFVKEVERLIASPNEARSK